MIRKQILAQEILDGPQRTQDAINERIVRVSKRSGQRRTLQSRIDRSKREMVKIADVVTAVVGEDENFEKEVRDPWASA